MPRYEGLEAQSSDYRAGGPNCKPSEISGLPNWIAKNERARCQEATEQHRLQSNDLVQQTRAANAAEESAWLTFHQSRLLVVGTIVGIFTLIAAGFAAYYAREAAMAARAAVTEAEKATNAANKALDETRKQVVIENRAWVSIRRTKLIEIRVIDATKIKFTFDITIKNTGNTPALRMDVRAYVFDGVDTPGRPPFVFTEKHREDYLSSPGTGFVVMPDDQTMRERSCEIHQTEWLSNLESQQTTNPVLIVGVFYRTALDDKLLGHTVKAFTIKHLNAWTIWAAEIDTAINVQSIRMADAYHIDEAT